MGAQAKDDAMDARNDRLWAEKYAAEDAKEKKECADRKRGLVECDKQRKQNMERDDELIRIQYEKDQRLLSGIEARNKEARAKDKADDLARKALKKQHGLDLKAQITETKARVPMDMTHLEREFNSHPS